MKIISLLRVPATYQNRRTSPTAYKVSRRVTKYRNDENQTKQELS